MVNRISQHHISPPHLPTISLSTFAQMRHAQPATLRSPPPSRPIINHITYNVHLQLRPKCIAFWSPRTRVPALDGRSGTMLRRINSITP
ncbi:hypothetical protein K432DRAFT_99235 [Lepidopterella palustris CBS 459.81]|uniref:Uncharacterized protein n=1 Tax=Lepidopterella palustris CBS 459.81 TaxID=1314670 RepID=A0A8E2JD39_9PEZI|nr:hypothetical protein K432DRAFT_99235 [Lepidopterella palustris CBS 459.81]